MSRLIGILTRIFPMSSRMQNLRMTLFVILFVVIGVPLGVFVIFIPFVIFWLGCFALLPIALNLLEMNHIWFRIHVNDSWRGATNAIVLVTSLLFAHFFWKGVGLFKNSKNSVWLK